VVLGEDHEEREAIAGALEIMTATSMPRSQNGGDGRRIIVFHPHSTYSHYGEHVNPVLYICEIITILVNRDYSDYDTYGGFYVSSKTKKKMKKKFLVSIFIVAALSP
jgi:hypothetical protein